MMSTKSRRDIAYPIISEEKEEPVIKIDEKELYFADRKMARDYYISQKPACFLVVGNPSTGKSTLARKLVKEMRCQYVHATDLIELNMKTNTTLGQYCTKQLLSGCNIPNKTLIALLRGAVSMPECLHYGYVMDGFPIYFKFDEHLELIENLGLKPDYIVHIELSDEDLRRRLESQRVDPVEGTIYNRYNLEDPPGSFQKLMAVKPPRPPASPDANAAEEHMEEGHNMEEHAVVEGHTGEDALPSSWHPEFPRPSKEVIRRLLVRPEDTQRELDKLFEMSKGFVQRTVERLLRTYPRTHVIKIDGNCPPTQMFYNLMVKVRALSIRPAIPPFPITLKEPGGEGEEGEGEEEEEQAEDQALAADTGLDKLFNGEPAEALATDTGVDEESTEAVDWDEAIAALAVRKMPTEHSRWQLSEWQRFCPVQLHSGILEYGSLFFLSSQAALKSFIRNPRPYLDLNGGFPQTPVRIAVVGFRKSGSVSLSRLIADRVGAAFVSLTDLLHDELEARQNEMLAKVKTEVEGTIMQKLNSQRKREVDEITTNHFVDNALSGLMARFINLVATEAIEKIVKPKRAAERPEGLKEAITEGHPRVVEAVTRAIRFAKAQPNYLEPRRYVDALVSELERLDYANRNINPAKRKPLNWVIEGLPPIDEVWTELKKRSKAIARDVRITRKASETLDKLERAMFKKTFGSKAGKGTEATEEGEGGEEADNEEALTEGVVDEASPLKKIPKSEEPENPYAVKISPTLAKARAIVDHLTTKSTPLDPLPLFVYKLKDELPDHALMIYRLYGAGFGPLEGLPAMSKIETMDNAAMEPMLASHHTGEEAAPDKADSNGRKTTKDEDDAVTLPPEDPPTVQSFYPMPQPGPEVDCVREQLANYDAAWENVKSKLVGSSTAHGVPIQVVELIIKKDKTLDELLQEVRTPLRSHFNSKGVVSSQDQLDEEAEAEAEAFADFGGLEDQALHDLVEEDKSGDEEMGNEVEGAEGETKEGADEEAGNLDEGSEEVNDEEEGGGGGGEDIAEEDPSRGSNRKLGQTSYFCPVAYHDRRVLKPGDPEIVATYGGQAYYFGSEEDMAKFMATPEKYVVNGYQEPLKPPPLRIVLLGPPGTGKTLHGRQLAGQFDLIHVCFSHMLQEVMLAKLKMRVGPEFADDKEVPVKVMPDLEDAVRKAVWALEHPEETAAAAAQQAEEEANAANPSNELTEEGMDQTSNATLTPHEVSIREFLENGEPLPEESLNQLIPHLWNDEPYRSKGFILEGFPRTADDVTYLVEHDLFVDFVIVFNAEVGDLLPRLLPLRIAKWKAKMAKINANKKIVADWKAKRKARVREERKKAILKTLSEKRMARFMKQSEGDVGNEEMGEDETDEGKELEDEANVSEMLDEEIPEEEEEMADEEDEEEAAARIEEEITERIEAETANAEDVVEALSEAKIPHFSIRADDKLTRVRYRIVKKIKGLVLNREAIFERVYPISLSDAENLVASGFKHPSMFGRFCPVTWNRVGVARLPPIVPSRILRYTRLNLKLIEPQIGDEFTPNIDGVRSKDKAKRKAVNVITTCAAVFRECVYWFHSPAERKLFSANPLAYIRAAGDLARTLRHQPLQVAIIGGPNSEREYVCKCLVKQFQVAHVTAAMAIQWFLGSVSHSWTALARQIHEVIMSGASIPDSIVIRVLQIALLAPQVQARGYILENFPITLDQTKCLSSMLIRPILILEMGNRKCNHLSIEMNWFENWNNQEPPPDCPFLRVWLNMQARRGRGGAAGVGGLSDGIGGLGLGMENAGRAGIARAAALSGSEGPAGTRGLVETGGIVRDGAEETEVPHSASRASGRGPGRWDRPGQGSAASGIEDVGGSGKKGNRGLTRSDAVNGDDAKNGGRRNRGREDGSDELEGRGARSKHDERSDEDGEDTTGGSRRQVHDKDNLGSGAGGVDGKGGRGTRPKHVSFEEGRVEGRKRKGRGADLGSDAEEDDSGGSGEEGGGVRGRDKRRGRRGGGASGSEEEDGAGFSSGRRGRGKKKRDSVDSSDDSDGEGGRGGRRGRGKRKKGRQESGNSDDESEGDGGRRGGRRRKKTGEVSDDSGDSSAHGVRKQRRKRKGHGNEDHSTEDEGTGGDGRHGRRKRRGKGKKIDVGGDVGQEWKSKRYRRIDDPLEERYKIPKLKGDRTPSEVLKHFAYLQNATTRRRWLEGHPGMLTDVPSEENSLISIKKSLIAITHRMAHVMEYLANKKQGKPMSVSEMGIVKEVFEKNLGKYSTYCPVRLHENNELFNCREEQTAPLVTVLPGAEASLPDACYSCAFDSTVMRYDSDSVDRHLQTQISTNLRFAVEYEGKMYLTAGPEELRKFVLNPDLYVNSRMTRDLPKDLPAMLPADAVPRDSFPKQIALRGFCPVCFQESNQHYEGLKVGVEGLYATFQDHIYAFCCVQCRTKFMRRPCQYADLRLPNKLPPMKAPVAAEDLPLPGYLEQTVAHVIRNALTMCSQFRPKHPFLSPERSAIVYMALQLKALNPRTPEYLRRRAKSRVEQFEQTCQLIDQLASTMPVDYVAERQRSETLSRQLRKFLALRGLSDNEDRWAYSV